MGQGPSYCQNSGWYNRGMVSLYEPDRDGAYVFTTWLKSYQFSNYAGCLPNNLFPVVYRSVIHDVIKRSTVYVLRDDLDLHRIQGFSVIEGDDILHYVSLRRGDLTEDNARLLLPNKHYHYTFRTNQSSEVHRVLPDTKFIFAPEIARRKPFPE